MNLNIGLNDITGQLLKKLINDDKKSNEKLFMLESDKYFNASNSMITDRRKMMMLYDDDDMPYVSEDFSKANNKIKHSYLQELVNQCTNYLVGKPVKIDYKQEVPMKVIDRVNEELYQNNNFLTFMQNNVKNIQLYGKSYFRVVRDGDFNKLVTYDPKEIIMFYDDFNKPVLSIRYFVKAELEEKGNDRTEIVNVRYAEVYDSQYKETFRWDKNGYVSQGREALYSTIATYGEGDMTITTQEIFDVETFPIIEWKFNEEGISTLANIKDFIDLQDINLSDLANNVEDIQEAVWILENYNGQSIQEFMEDLKKKKAVKVGQGGKAEPKTIDIPIEARKELYDKCNKNIYKFGFGVDFSERESLGNVSGVALKWSYAPLEQKANAIENNAQEPLDVFFNILFKLMGLDITSNDLEYIFDRSMIANNEEQTRTVMSASSQLSQKTILDNLPMVKNSEEEMERLDAQNEYDPNLSEEIDTTGETDTQDNGDGTQTPDDVSTNSNSGK